MSAIDTLREYAEVWRLFGSMPDDATLSAEVSALYLGVSVKTLARYRQTGNGPAYIQYQAEDSKARNQRVNYLLGDLRIWRDRHKVSSTMEAAQVRGLAFAIHCFTEKGDKVMVLPPVYHPFFLVTQKNEREVVFSPLVLKEGQYHIDFDRFRKDVQGCKLLILSNPHNPGGRVWTKEELSQIADICYESGTLVISDEIHADLTLPPYKHPAFALISEKARMNSLVFMSPSKAFNMPGLASSYAIIENDELRHRFQVYMEAGEFSEGHLFAYLSVAAAYSHGTEWLDQVIAYIKANIDFTENYLKEHIPAIRMIRPQASYLIFLDCRELGLNQKELNNLFVEDAHLALNEGTTFGKEGEGFMRLNIACPRATLEKALKQLEQAVNNR